MVAGVTLRQRRCAGGSGGLDGGCARAFAAPAALALQFELDVLALLEGVETFVGDHGMME
jgi:hypothetical protein